MGSSSNTPKRSALVAGFSSPESENQPRRKRARDENPGIRGKRCTLAPTTRGNIKMNPQGISSSSELSRAKMEDLTRSIYHSLVEPSVPAMSITKMEDIIRSIDPSLLEPIMPAEEDIDWSVVYPEAMIEMTRPRPPRMGRFPTPARSPARAPSTMDLTKVSRDGGFPRITGTLNEFSSAYPASTGLVQNFLDTYPEMDQRALDGFPT